MKGIRRKIVYGEKELELREDEIILSADTIGDYDVKIEIESRMYGTFVRCVDLHFDHKISTTTLIDKCRGVKLEIVYNFNEVISEAKIDILAILQNADIDIVQLMIENNININKLLIDAGVDIEELLVSAGINVKQMLNDAGIEGVEV